MNQRKGSPANSGHLRSKVATAALLMCAFAMLFAQTSGQAAAPAPPDALPYSKGFLVTGNYVAGFVDLTSQANPADANGYATGTIPINDTALAGGVNLVAAYLYFEAVHPDLTPLPAAADPAVGIKFRDTPINQSAMKVVTKSLTSGGATCWGAAGQGAFAVSTYRANVLGLMPKQLDHENKWTGKYIVNSSELSAAGYDPHKVTLREKTGDSAIQTAGATLFLVYRLLDPSEPLRKIVVYDGLYTAYGMGISSATAEADTMFQSLKGFYKSTGPAMRITHVVGTGGNNQTEKIQVKSKNSTVNIGPPPNSADPFPQTSPNSDRSWASPTYDVGKPPSSSFMPGSSDSTYGENVTTSVSASNTTPAACRAWTAVFASFNVLDFDGDGLPDGVEDGLATKDPDNTNLPNLKAMGAKSKNADDTPHRDLFVEYNAMWAAAGTTYGSVNAPYPNTAADCYDNDTKSCTDTAGHQHFLTPEDFKRIGDRYKLNKITAHFDVGKLGVFGDCTLHPGYHCLGVVPHTDWVDDYTSHAADEYLVGSGTPSTNVETLARGGEVIKEVGCDPADPQYPCDSNFPDYPGTVGWKIGYLALRNAPVGNQGQELNPDLTDPNNASFDWTAPSPQSEHRLRFDRERRPYFHYALSAHTRGTPSSPLPCLVAGQPANYPASGACVVGADPTKDGPNPQFHVPSGSRGLADLPGRNVLLSLGLWDEFVGRPFAREGANFHELGHNANLWHSGKPADFGNATTSTVIYPNCNPFVLSSMSYLYSIHGLFDPNGDVQLDYSGQELTGQTESLLSDGAYSSTPAYQRAWYAPAGSALALSEGVPAATRFCSGVGQPTQSMARVLSASDTYNQQTGTWSIDWNGNTEPDNATQDANFDGVPDQTFSGFDDWGHIRLNQISAGGLGGGTEDFILVAHPAADDLINFGGDDLINFGGDDLITFGGDDLITFGGDDNLINFGGDDLINFGGDDLISFGGDDLINLAGDVQPEPTYAGAKGLGRTEPYSVRACIVGTTGCFADTQPFNSDFHRVAVSWQPATVGHIDPTQGYEVQRRRADQANSGFEAVGTTTGTFVIDHAVLPKLKFIYRVRAHFDDPTAASAWAYLRGDGFEAQNDVPVARTDSYVVAKNATNSVTILKPGVLGKACTTATQCTTDTPGTLGDPSSDNPTDYVAQRAVFVTGSGPFIKGTNTPIGTLSWNSTNDGGFTLTYPSAFTGSITFQYKANDGDWSVDSTVPMNGKDGQGNQLFSGPVTVTVEIKKK
jgi:hypothetical protein